MSKSGSLDWLPLSLCLQKALVFVGGGAADVAHSRQFADVELPVLVCGVVAKKGGGDVLSLSIL